PRRGEGRAQTAQGLTKNPSSGTKGASLVADGVGVRHSALLPEAAPNARLVRASDGASERAPPNRAATRERTTVRPSALADVAVEPVDADEARPARSRRGLPRGRRRGLHERPWRRDRRRRGAAAAARRRAARRRRLFGCLVLRAAARRRRGRARARRRRLRDLGLDLAF